MVVGFLLFGVAGFVPIWLDVFVGGVFLLNGAGFLPGFGVFRLIVFVSVGFIPITVIVFVVGGLNPGNASFKSRLSSLTCIVNFLVEMNIATMENFILVLIVKNLPFLFGGNSKTNAFHNAFHCFVVAGSAGCSGNVGVCLAPKYPNMADIRLL